MTDADRLSSALVQVQEAIRFSFEIVQQNDTGKVFAKVVLPGKDHASMSGLFQFTLRRIDPELSCVMINETKTSHPGVRALDPDTKKMTDSTSVMQLVSYLECFIS